MTDRSKIPLSEALRIFGTPNAEKWATALFKECFRAPFPVPRNNCGLPVPTPPENWRQDVALYTHPDGTEEAVGFCNWIRLDEVYLEGGLCVKSNIYRRMSKEHFRTCRQLGGIAQMIMEKASTELNDRSAWFGYCGDAKSLAVNLRVGYVRTHHPHLIVKWFKSLSTDEKRHLMDSIARIGPF